MRPIEAVKTFDALVKRRGWNTAQTLAFIKACAARGLAPAPVEGGSANFTQISGPNGGRVQTLNAAAGPVTFLWNPQSLKGQLAGGDFLYTRRFKFRSVINMTNTTEGTNPIPNWQQLAQTFGQVRVYSPFLGEMVPKNLNSVPIISNHDQYFSNGFRPITRKRPIIAPNGGATVNVEFIFEIAFERDYLTRAVDSCPWLPFFEGGTLEVDVGPQGSLSNYGWQVNSVTQTCTADWFPDKQAIIHSPIQNRLYRVTTSGPEWVLKSVGAPNGLDGVISGSRLAVLSWLGHGLNLGTPGAPVGDNGFYAAFGGSGGQFWGTTGLNRLDVPFRDQTSIDDVSAWLESFLADCNPTRMMPNLNIETGGAATSDLNQWPFIMGGSTATFTPVTGGATAATLIADFLDFFPLIFPSPGDKISDFQKVNGDLSFTATQSSPSAVGLNLFRTDEVCGFTPDKVMDLMDRMGMPHVQRGGTYTFVPKYAGAKKADPTTVWGFPLKIISAK